MIMGGQKPYLPEEIITEILKRLEVKSLIKFQCVSKQWKNLIKSPSFIAQHLYHSTNRPSLLSFRSPNICDPLKIHLMGPEMNARALHTPHFLLGSSKNWSIICSSNGLFCVVSRKYMIGSQPLVVSQLSLWNPATREFRDISGTITKEILGYGFGFSAIVNDYKIVQIHGDNNNAIEAVKVFSLNTRSWKEIGLGSLEGVKLCQGDCVTANGCIFWAWKVEGGVNYNIMIHSFDIAMEVFTLIPSPPLSNIRRKVLTVYEDKVTMLTLSTIGTVDLWVLKEDGGSWSWTKKFTSNPCPSTFDLELPRIVWGNKIVVGYKYGCTLFGGGTYLMDMSTNVKRVLSTDIPLGDLFIYVESLVPIGNIFSM